MVRAVPAKFLVVIRSRFILYLAGAFYRLEMSGVILKDSEKGKLLGLTEQNFIDAFVWDCRPKYLGVVRLKPRSVEGLKEFFELGANIYSTIVITAPEKDVEELAQFYGYEKKIDVAGLPYLTDESVKKISRQNKEKLFQKVSK